MFDSEYDELKQERADLAQRELELERSALRLLQHHPWRHTSRLLFAALGFRVREDDPAITADKPADELAAT